MTPPPILWETPPIPDGPLELESAEPRHVRLVVMTKELERPWSIAFLPNDAMLVTERAGRYVSSGTAFSIQSLSPALRDDGSIRATIRSSADRTGSERRR